DQRRKQHAIGKDQAAGRGAETGGAGGDRREIVADVALADDQAGEILERVLDADGVDRRGNAFGVGGDAGGGHRQRRGAGQRAGHRDLGFRRVSLGGMGGRDGAQASGGQQQGPRD